MFKRRYDGVVDFRYRSLVLDYILKLWAWRELLRYWMINLYVL